MNLYINGTTLTINSAVAQRNTATGVITLFVKVPYAEMEYADLKILFKTNTEDMIKTAEDGTEETFAGEFAYKKTEDDDVNEVYTVILTTNENDFQLARNRQLEKDKASLESTVAVKNSEISNLNVAISEKDKAIAEREATIEAKDNMISEKDTVIEEKEVVISEQAETITALESTVSERDTEIAEKDEVITAKDTVIGEKEVVITEQTEIIATLEAEIEELKNGTGEVDLSEFATALEEGVNDYE